MTGIDFGELREPQDNISHENMMKLGTALSKIGVNITDEYIIKDDTVEDLIFQADLLDFTMW
jgi:hypothetical protein